MSAGDRTAGRWWGEFEIPEGACRRWRIGPLSLWSHHHHNEWVIAHQLGEDPRDAALEIASPGQWVSLEQESKIQRFASSQIDGVLSLSPILADRPVVVRPEPTFSLLAGDEVRLYVTTPAWVRIEAGSQKQRLTEIPSFRPSDSWFGANTMEGELCYASRTTASLLVDDASTGPGRAITMVTLRNRSGDALKLERLKLPIPNLALHASEDGRLWTDRITLERTESGEEAEIRLEGGPPGEAGATERIAGQRIEEKTNVLVRAVTGLFG